MEQDFFSQISKKLSGLDITFVLMGFLWLVGMILTLNRITAFDFLILVPTWAGFAGLYWFLKRRQVKSNWKSISLVVIGLLFWKAVIQVSAIMLL